MKYGRALVIDDVERKARRWFVFDLRSNRGHGKRRSMGKSSIPIGFKNGDVSVPVQQLVTREFAKLRSFLRAQLPQFLRQLPFTVRGEKESQLFHDDGGLRNVREGESTHATLRRWADRKMGRDETP